MNDAAKENWNKLALQFIRVYLAKNKYVLFTTEDVAEKAWEDCIPEPSHPRAWGPVFQRAARENLIRKCISLATGKPYTSLTKSKHRSPLWEAVD